MARNRNPVLNQNTFRGDAWANSDPMTLGGTVNKSFVLLAIAVATGAVSWAEVSTRASANAWAIGAAILAMVLSFITSRNPQRAPILAPVFAAVEGVFLGVVSHGYESAYHGIVAGAVFATVVTFAIVLLSYTSELIKVTDRMMRTISVAMFSIFIFYVLSFVLNLAHVATPWMTSSSPLGIAFNVLVIVVAAAMLLVDFEMISRGVAARAPKYMEWYGGFALLVQVVWLYLEFLRLLARIQSR